MKTTETIIRDTVRRLFGHRPMTHVCDSPNLGPLTEGLVRDLHAAGRLTVERDTLTAAATELLAAVDRLPVAAGSSSVEVAARAVQDALSGGDQHPMFVMYMAHCVRCGTYVDDTRTRPPADFLCPTCEREG